MVLKHPACAESSAHFFVWVGHQDHVAVERNVLSIEQQKGHQLHDTRTFHIHGATSPYVPVRHVTTERRMTPLGTVGRHNIHVIHEQKWFRSATTLEASHYDRFPRGRLVASDCNAVSFEDVAQEVSRFGHVARR